MRATVGRAEGSVAVGRVARAGERLRASVDERTAASTAPAHPAGVNGSRAPAATGLLLLDASLRPVYYNSEAAAILSYPQRDGDIGPLAGRLPDAIAAWLLRRESSASTPSVLRFMSGRRHYDCRTFTLAHHDARSPRPPLTALLLERTLRKSIDFAETAAKFHLTRREQEAVGLLTLGLTGKEIAARMNVSPNTVKCFMRLVMTKMAVSTRSGVVGRIARL